VSYPETGFEEINCDFLQADFETTFDMGFRDFAVLDSSPYFASLCSDPQLQQLTQRYRK
jgi:hypothetical protein